VVYSLFDAGTVVGGLFLEVYVRIRNMIGTLVVAVAMFVFATPAAAQDPQPVTVSGGVSFFHFNNCCTEPGFRVEVAKIFRQMTNGNGLALAGELGWTTSDGSSTLTLAAGPRYVLSTGGSAQPFVHVLLGLARYGGEGFGNTNFLIGPGGGVSFPINENLSGFGQLDFMIVKGDGFTDYGQRFTFGVIFELGQ
jgi:hypothetical protein